MDGDAADPAEAVPAIQRGRKGRGICRVGLYASEAVEARLQQQPDPELAPMDWKSGDRPWLVNLFAPFEHTGSVIRLLRESEVRGRNIKMRQWNDDGSIEMKDLLNSNDLLIKIANLLNLALYPNDDNQGSLRMESRVPLYLSPLPNFRHAFGAVSIYIFLVFVFSIGICSSHSLAGDVSDLDHFDNWDSGLYPGLVPTRLQWLDDDTIVFLGEQTLGHLAGKPKDYIEAQSLKTVIVVWKLGQAPYSYEDARWSALAGNQKSVCAADGQISYPVGVRDVPEKGQWAVAARGPLGHTVDILLHPIFPSAGSPYVSLGIPFGPRQERICDSYSDPRMVGHLWTTDYDRRYYLDFGVHPKRDDRKRRPVPTFPSSRAYVSLPPAPRRRIRMDSGSHKPNSMPNGYSRVEVITGVGRRRQWTYEQKARIVAESYSPSTTVSAVARRHQLNTNQLFQWRKEFADARALWNGRPEPRFVPLVADAEPMESDVAVAPPAIEVVAGKLSVRVPHGVDAATLRQVLGVVREFA